MKTALEVLTTELDFCRLALQSFSRICPKNDDQLIVKIRTMKKYQDMAAEFSDALNILENEQARRLSE